MAQAATVELNTAPTLEESVSAQPAMPTNPTRQSEQSPTPVPESVLDASDRVMKQLNFDLTERQHLALKALVATMPAMSVRKFLVAATLEKMERVRKGQTRTNHE